MFKANFISGGDAMADALIYKPPPPSLMEYLSNSMRNVMDNASVLGNRFVSMVSNMYNKHHSEEARNASKMMLYNAGVHIDQNVIVPVKYEQLHLANQCMQNYILTQPTLADLYRKDMCYGYADTYMPIEIDTYGKDTLAYGQVMDGVLQTDDETDECYFEYYSQDDECLGGELHTMDKLSILDTWDNVARMLEEGIDPTDPVLDVL